MENLLITFNVDVNTKTEASIIIFQLPNLEDTRGRLLKDLFFYWV